MTARNRFAYALGFLLTSTLLNAATANKYLNDDCKPISPAVLVGEIARLSMGADEMDEIAAA